MGIRWSGALVLLAAGALVASCAPPSGGPPLAKTVPPTSGDPLLPDPLDCENWRYDGVERGPLPPGWDEEDHRFTSRRDPGSRRSPQRLCGQVGMGLDLAWGVELGDPDVVVAVLDSGMQWRDPEVMADLAENTYLNCAELPPPLPPAEGPDPYDTNGDGRCTVADYENDPRVWDRNGNGVIDPEDLILTPEFNTGRDDSGTGFVDDIAGWDFVNNDNNPFDSADYGHGVGQTLNAVAPFEGTDRFGMCPACRHLPVRVADTFIAEGGRFAAGVLFSVDSGADVIGEALGAISNPPQAQQAIDAAHRRGVPVVASMADEQSQHANLPAALNHTIPVNSITDAAFLGDITNQLAGRRDSLALNGCTNFGGITWISVPSNGCSSEATGNGSGLAGLIGSAARRSGIEPHPDLVAQGRAGPGRNVLSADEVAQIMRATADDIDFSTPNARDGANRFRDDLGQGRFETRRGWDATHGYGRANAYEMVRAASSGDIPPEADLTSPTWFSVHPTQGRLPIEGRVAAVRSSSFDYRVEWTTGLQAPRHPGADQWRVVAGGEGLSEPRSGVLAELDLAEVAAALPGAATGPPVDERGRPDPDRFTVRIRVVVTDAEGRVGTFHRHLAVHDDPDLVAMEQVEGTGTSSPVFADLDGDGNEELVLAADDGHVHVLGPDGSPRSGFPVRTPTADYWPASSVAANEDGIEAPGAAISIGAPAIADLTGDGRSEIVVTDLDGGVHVWDADGTAVSSMRSDPRFSQREDTGPSNRLTTGFIASPSLGDLTGDGRPEIIAAAKDRHVYAWHVDGTAVDGFPVLVVDPAKVEAVDPERHTVTFRSDSGVGNGGELIATTAVADLTGDGRDEIVVGAQEQYVEPIVAFPGVSLPGTSGNTRLYAISPDGTNGDGPIVNPAHPDQQAYLPGWPQPLPMVLTSVLPTIGDGVAVQAAIGDVTGDGSPEIVATSVAGQTRVLRPDGSTAYGAPFGLPVSLNWLGATPPGSNSGDVGAILSAFGGPAIGDVYGNRGLDVVQSTSGLGRALDTLLPNHQDGDPHLTVWDGRNGQIRPGFPRVTADLAFFVTPAVVDVDGDGSNEVVAGHGVHLLDAFGRRGSTPTGWPKLTGGWVVGTPGTGDWTGDGTAELAVVRRDGVLMVWNTPTPSDAIGDWTRYGADDRNSGSVTPRS